MANLMSKIFGNKPSSSSSDKASPPGDIEHIINSVWELRKHNGEIPNVKIIFFHGLQTGDFKNAFWQTWQSEDTEGSGVWPKEWLGEKFPHARILSVSYNSSAKADESQLDMHSLGENLVTDIILKSEDIDQNCPVVLVGHSLGGIVIKQLVLSALDIRRNSKDETEKRKINTFLEQNLKGVFYYSTPHHGSRIADLASHIPGTSPYVVLLKTLSVGTERINEAFRKQRVKLKAKAAAIGEKLPTEYMGFHMVVVEEASARSDIDNFYTASTSDHFNVCKPQNKRTAAFTNLCDFIVKATDIQISQADPLTDLT